jgi:hypothetical protein
VAATLVLLTAASLVKRTGADAHSLSPRNFPANDSIRPCAKPSSELASCRAEIQEPAMSRSTWCMRLFSSH